MHYRSSLTAPYRMFSNIALLGLIVLATFGHTFPQVLMLFIQMRIILQLCGCGMDLFFSWKIRDLPDEWWIIDLGQEIYVFQTREAADANLSG
ncbi:MAG: hypothetical protein ACPLRW_07455 [Moorellales bacterium]